MNEENIKEALDEALSQLIRSDADLLRIDANERSITHRIALYLEKYFSGWNVDCEYNRDGHEPKRLGLNPEQISSDDTNGKTVYPDIIVHKRNTDNNLLVIEVKKTFEDAAAEHDREKLRLFKNEFGYQYAAFVKVVAERYEIEWQ